MSNTSSSKKNTNTFRAAVYTVIASFLIGGLMFSIMGLTWWWVAPIIGVITAASIATKKPANPNAQVTPKYPVYRERTFAEKSIEAILTVAIWVAVIIGGLSFISSEFDGCENPLKTCTKTTIRTRGGFAGPNGPCNTSNVRAPDSHRVITAPKLNVKFPR